MCLFVSVGWRREVPEGKLAFSPSASGFAFFPGRAAGSV